MALTQSDSRETLRLLEAAAQGNAHAFQQLFEKHRASLRRLISLRLDDRLRARLDPSDLLQEANLVACQRFDDFIRKRPMPFRLWLRKLTQQQLYDARRNHIHRRRRSLLREEGPLNRSSILIARSLVAEQSPADKMARREQQLRVAAAVAALGELDREIVVMRNVEGLAFDEIAQVLDLQPPAVRQRYGRALIKLRSKLKKTDPSA